MADVIEYVKKNPVIVIGGGVLIFIVLRAASAGGGGSSGGASANPDAVLSANTQLQMASLQSGTQVQLASIASSSQASSIAAEREIQLASIAADRATSNEMFQAQLAALTTQVTLSNSNLNAQMKLAEEEAVTTRFGIEKSTTVQLAQLAQQQAANETIARTQTELAALNAEVTNNSIFANRDIAIRQSDNAVRTAAIAAEMGSDQSNASMWGTIAVAALYAVSDRAAKCNVVSKGMHPCGLPLYEYEYLPELRDALGHGRKLGFMHDDVLRMFPDAVILRDDGYHAVNYSAILQ